MMSSQRSSVILRLRQRNLTLVTMFSIPMKLVQILLSYLKTMDQSHLMVLLLFEILQWASGFTLNSVYRNGKLPRKTKVFGRPKDGNGDSTGMQRVHSRQIPSSTLWLVTLIFVMVRAKSIKLMPQLKKYIHKWMKTIATSKSWTQLLIAGRMSMQSIRLMRTFGPRADISADIYFDTMFYISRKIK